MARQLAQRGLRSADAGAVITVSTTLQTFAQMVFTVAGLIVLALGQGAVGTSGSVYLHVHQAGHQAGPQALDLREPLAAATLAFALLLGGFYLAQRRGLFGGMARLAAKFRSKTDWSSLQQKAEAIDAAVQALYRHRRRALASFALSLLGWAVGTVEVWLILQFIGHPLGWVDALLLESLGQAIRGAAFMIPGSLGVQEGGYLLLGPLVGLPPEAALALSLAKRSRELLLGLPGIVYLHFSERGWQRRRARQLHATDQTVS
jgi:putative membrane protein